MHNSGSTDATEKQKLTAMQFFKQNNEDANAFDQMVKKFPRHAAIRR